MASLLGRLEPATPLAAVQRAWPGAVGETISAQATPTAVRGGVLSVTCRSSVWAQELEMMGPELIERLNGAVGDRLIMSLRASASAPRSWTDPVDR
jgi:predicted nucleic acid-binding Zn ribbon protein